MSHLTPQQCLDYVLDQLPDAERERVEEHIADCPACAAAVAAAAADEIAFRDALQLSPEDVSTDGGPSTSAWFRPLAAVGGILSIAAVFLLFFRTSPIPEYTLTVAPAVRQFRSVSEVQLYAGQSMDVSLRPAHDTTSPQVHLFVGQEGEWQTLDARIETAPTGAVRARVSAPVTPGVYTLIAVLTPAGSSAATASDIQDCAHISGWRCLEEEVTFLPSP
ncbi:MAG: zf-HC2 domain-containing protein [Myxococcota bacterium]